MTSLGLSGIERETMVVGRRASRREHLVFLGAGLWLMVGLCLDGWAHRHQPELESFFTPWHAVFYAGFSASVATLAVMVIRRRSQASSLWDAVPTGYELSVVGFGIFAVGGIGDGFWHTIFGVETSVDALLSPTHLLMLVGMSMAVAAPVRDAEAERSEAGTSDALTVSSFLPVILSIGLLTTGVAFFFLYANGFSNWPTTRTYIPNESDLLAGFGVLSTLASTVILLTPTLYVLRRWHTPFGAFTVIYGVVGVFMAGLDAFAEPWQILAPLAGGLTADFVARSLRGSRHLGLGIGLLVPLIMWSVSTLATHLAWTIEWPPELWVGQVVMAMLTGLGLALLTRQPDAGGT